MRQRDDTEFEEKRRRIIDGALGVFAEKGFDGATNKLIASAAGINSPGLIYHYFADKYDLFRETISAHIPLLQLLSHPEEMMALPPREALTHFGRAYLAILKNPQAEALMKLILGETVRQPRIAQVFREMGPERALGFLAKYLEEQMDAGVLRRQDAATAARAFAAPLIVFVLQRVIFRSPAALQEEPERVLTSGVDIFLRGMQTADRNEQER